MKKFLPFVIAALIIPGVALAKGKPPTAGTHTNQSKAKVMYVLKGLIYNYTAFDSSTNTPGSLTIAVSHSNRHGKLLVGQPPLTVTIGPNTKVLLTNGVASIAAAAPGDNGMVKIRASRLAFKSATVADVQNALTNQPAHQVIDWGPSS
jgi:hypothetical protein